MSNFNLFMENMWQDYIKINPQAHKIFNLFKSENETIVNDHIALRTFDTSSFGIANLSKHFINYGYTLADQEYFFTEKKLYARHFEHANPTYPKIFISELLVSKMSDFTQKTIAEITKELPKDFFNSENCIFAGRPWSANFKAYETLAQESEYASWVYAYGFRPNHFTVSVNNLKKFTQLAELNTFIKNQGIILNTSGGEIKGTPAELLEQSSTMANKIPVKFDDGSFEIPGCYYEFAKRYTDSNGQLYQGFIAKSADKIFESTNRT